ncbi:YraN family protein [Embleya sp. NBC_00896]|uniref:YraN family protein n=1 Tax=Embleya sp. NBC_00896 TaxID=2975961 RepID=UPI0038702BA1|nr:YraN family protein [Embleya sp. NBC_00896]
MGIGTGGAGGRPGRSRNGAVGRYGERVAARYLVEQGMAVLDRNWRCRDGEIDIVARDGPTLVVCEVKTRRAGGFEHPLEAIGAVKTERLRVLAERWLLAHPLGGPPGREVRIDLVAVVPAASGAAHVEHVRGVC